jgi:integrase/recombinase XerD
VETEQAIERFLASPGLGDATRRAYRGDVEEFGRWLKTRHLTPDNVDIRVLTEYVAELGRARPRKLAPATIARKVAAVRSFLRFSLGPAQVPDASLAPRRPRRLPDTPKLADVEAALAALDGDGALALRNRALVELLYSAGLRSSEAVGLDLADLDFDREQLHVRGKGGKERIVPLGEEAGHLLAR